LIQNYSTDSAVWSKLLAGTLPANSGMIPNMGQLAADALANKYAPITDYALIGDCRSAGLVSRDGSLDWLCFPRFDSASIFGALLDADRGGRFRIKPSGQFSSTRAYVAGTNVLETTFRTSTGTARLRDVLPVSTEQEKRQALTPDHHVLREIVGVDGAVELEVEYDPRPGYGRCQPRLEQRGPLGLWCEAGRGALVLRSDVPLLLAQNAGARGQFTIHARERKYLSLGYAEQAPQVLPPLGATATAAMDRSCRWWLSWISGCNYDGPYRDAVVRSALTLKLMAYAPSGALVAAPTTSLPERIGGVRNWDYRYCWLRDASFTVRALLALGYDNEAEAFVQWMLHATRLTWPELQVVYDVYGEARLPETELTHLDGYDGSRPVRIGNDAHGQLQLDVYGEVIDAVSRFASRGGEFDHDTAKLLDGMGHTVCKRWSEPDEGIWEARSQRMHHTHSKVLCWVALDRLVRLHELGKLRVCVDEFRNVRDAIRAQIEMHGYNETLGSYTSTFDGNDLDASLLVLPLYGYIPGDHPRMRSTCQQIYAKLGRGSLLYRYDSSTQDGFPIGEGAFGICGFWGVECRALGGDVAGATRAFEELLSCANDVGLLAEEVDPANGAALGNFPQAFTHIGLINAALTLAQCAAGTSARAEAEAEGLQ
jgi:GH15 family glucan-1,4-alpha-glucosidase